MLDLRIGLWLGLRQIGRANPWASALIVTVIVFTFLNLVVVSGLLIGIVDGGLKTTRAEATGDLRLLPLEGEHTIAHTEQILHELETYTAVESFTPHYTGLATIEANYAERRDLNAEPDQITVTITGINTLMEDRAMGISSLINEGDYFDPQQTGYIVFGKYNFDRHADRFGGAIQTLNNVFPGDTVRVTVGAVSEEFIVKGVVDSKVDLLSFKVFLPEREFRRLYNRADFNASEILIQLKPDYTEFDIKKLFIKNGMSAFTKIETFNEGTPSFIANVVETFDLVGLFVGFIGVCVASITIFIVIFINALSRRRQIGILKAIGITERAIEWAYSIQAIIYTLVGSAIGACLTLVFIVPYFDAHPIDFPYGNTSISVTTPGVLLRCLLLLGITLVAGFVPAWLITRQNTLNSILGRK